MLKSGFLLGNSFKFIHPYLLQFGEQANVAFSFSHSILDKRDNLKMFFASRYGDLKLSSMKFCSFI